MKVVREFSDPHSDYLTIHVDRRLTRSMRFWDDGKENDFSLREKKKKTPDFIIKILRIRGVTGRITLEKYRIGLEKGAAFSWDTITPKVIEVLRKAFDPKGVVEELPESPRTVGVDGVDYQLEQT